MLFVVSWSYGRPPWPQIVFRESPMYCIITNTGPIYLVQLHSKVPCCAMVVSCGPHTFKTVFNGSSGAWPTLSSLPFNLQGVIVPLHDPCNGCMRFTKPSTEFTVPVSLGNEGSNLYALIKYAQPFPWLLLLNSNDNRRVFNMPPSNLPPIAKAGVTWFIIYTN